MNYLELVFTVWLCAMHSNILVESSPCTSANADGYRVWEHNGWCYVHSTEQRNYTRASCGCRFGFTEPLRYGTLLMDPTFSLHVGPPNTPTLMLENLMNNRTWIVCHGDRPMIAIDNPSVAIVNNGTAADRCVHKNHIMGGSYDYMYQVTSCENEFEYTCQYSLVLLGATFGELDYSYCLLLPGQSCTGGFGCVNGSFCNNATNMCECTNSDLPSLPAPSVWTMASAAYKSDNKPTEGIGNRLGTDVIGVGFTSCNILCISTYGCTAFTILYSTGTCRLHHNQRPGCLFTLKNGDAKLFKLLV